MFNKCFCSDCMAGADGEWNLFLRALKNYGSGLVCEPLLGHAAAAFHGSHQQSLSVEGSSCNIANLLGVHVQQQPPGSWAGQRKLARVVLLHGEAPSISVAPISWWRLSGNGWFFSPQEIDIRTAPTIRVILCGKSNVCWRWRMKFVAPGFVHDVTYHVWKHFAWQVQYLVVMDGLVCYSAYPGYRCRATQITPYMQPLSIIKMRNIKIDRPQSNQKTICSHIQ